MADKSLVLQLLITAKDTASEVFSKLYGFLDRTTSATANLLRSSFTNVFGGALQGAVEFEAQMDRVAAKGGYTAEEMTGLADQARAVGAAFGVSGTESGKALEALAAAGLDAKAAIGALPPVLALAASEQISTDAAATKLIDSLSVMGLGFEETARVADVFAKGANITTSSAAQLAEALTQAGGLARAAGMDLEYTVAALDLLHKNGIKGAEAGTALKSILTSLLDPSSKASAELNKLGISSRDLGGVLEALQKKGGAASTAILAFGTEAGPGLRALLAEGKTGLDDYTQQLQNADGAAQDAADAMGGNLKTAIASLSSIWESLKASLVEPLLGPIAKEARELAGVFAKAISDGDIKGIQDLLRAFGTDIADGIDKAIKSFDFDRAKQAVLDFETGAKTSFTAVTVAASASAGAIKVAFNLIMAPIRVLVGSFATTVGNLFTVLAEVERQAAKVGLGTVEKADELLRKAQAAKETAKDLAAVAEQDFKDLQAGATQTLAAFDRVGASIQRASTEADQVKPPDFGRAETLTPINNTLDDYAGKLESARKAQAAAADAADAAQTSYLEIGRLWDQGSASLYAYEKAKQADQAAQAALRAAVAATTTAETDFGVARLKATQAVIDGSDRELNAATASIQSNAQLTASRFRTLELAGQEVTAQGKVANAAVATAQAELALAQASGNRQQVADAALALSEREVTALQAKRAAQEIELQQYQTASNRIDELIARKGPLNDADAKELQALKDKYPQLTQLIGAQEQQINQTDALIAKQQLEAQQAAIMAGPIGQLSRLYAANTAEHERASDASAAYYDKQLNEIDGAIRIAEARGDEAKKAELVAEKQQILIDQAYALAAAKAQEAEDAQNAVAVKTMELAADGLLSAADQEQIANLQAVADSKEAAAQKARDNASAMEAEAEAAKEVAKASKDSKDNIDAANESFKTTAEDLNKLNVAVVKFRDESVAGFGTQNIREYNAIVNQIQASIGEANTQAERLASHGMAAATDSTLELADALINSNSYLNDAAHAAGTNLKNALQDAKNAAMDLREELTGIAQDYSEKILDLTGDELTQLYVDQAQALAEAQDKYSKAGMLATQAYTDATKAIRAYYDLAIAKQKEADAADAVGKTAANMQSLNAATKAATQSAEALAKTNLSGIINQTDTLTTKMHQVWNLL